jgi:hypothetical protein
MLLDQPLEHEQIRIVRGDRTGTTIIVAVHSTALGPAIGGCRLRHYPTWRDSVDDALRLSAAMTDKCSLAGIDHGGGGKTVAVLPAGSASATHRIEQCCAPPPYSVIVRALECVPGSVAAQCGCHRPAMTSVRSRAADHVCVPRNDKPCHPITRRDPPRW